MQSVETNLGKKETKQNAESELSLNVDVLKTKLKHEGLKQRVTISYPPTSGGLAGGPGGHSPLADFSKGHQSLVRASKTS